MLLMCLLMHWLRTAAVAGVADVLCVLLLWQGLLTCCVYCCCDGSRSRAVCTAWQELLMCCVYCLAGVADVWTPSGARNAREDRVGYQGEHALNCSRMQCRMAARVKHPFPVVCSAEWQPV